MENAGSSYSSVPVIVNNKMILQENILPTPNSVASGITSNSLPETGIGIPNINTSIVDSSLLINQQQPSIINSLATNSLATSSTLLTPNPSGPSLLHSPLLINPISVTNPFSPEQITIPPNTPFLCQTPLISLDTGTPSLNMIPGTPLPLLVGTPLITMNSSDIGNTQTGCQSPLLSMNNSNDLNVATSSIVDNNNSIIISTTDLAMDQTVVPSNSATSIVSDVSSNTVTAIADSASPMNFNQATAASTVNSTNHKDDGVFVVPPSPVRPNHKNSQYGRNNLGSTNNFVTPTSTLSMKMNGSIKNQLKFPVASPIPIISPMTQYAAGTLLSLQNYNYANKLEAEMFQNNNVNVMDSLGNVNNVSNIVDDAKLPSGSSNTAIVRQDSQESGISDKNDVKFEIPQQDTYLNDFSPSQGFGHINNDFNSQFQSPSTDAKIINKKSFSINVVNHSNSSGSVGSIGVENNDNEFNRKRRRILNNNNSNNVSSINSIINTTNNNVTSNNSSSNISNLINSNNMNNMNMGNVNNMSNTMNNSMGNMGNMNKTMGNMTNINNLSNMNNINMTNMNAVENMNTMNNNLNGMDNNLDSMSNMNNMNNNLNIMNSMNNNMNMNITNNMNGMNNMNDMNNMNGMNNK